MSKAKIYIIIFICLFIFNCNDNKENALFTSLKKEVSNIGFSNDLQNSEHLNILDYLYYYNGGGVSIGDINNDNLPDIYFTGNMVKNKLYLNKGNMVFDDVTQKAGVSGSSDWNTGTIMVDINGDGLLDIYVCAVVGINKFEGHNELFINNGNGTFTERAKEFGLDFKNYGTTAAFFDYDLDGDLDMYLLNHAIHTEDSFGKASIRDNRTNKSGDKLLRNDNGIFTDVSDKSGIYGSPNGYGLGLAISDFNQDGYPDIYVGNDFHEDDYFYINNGNGTFTESLKNYFGHVSKFSMGNDVADINHDGFPDLISLDMLPYNETVLKKSHSGNNNSFSLEKIQTQDLGYHYQYSRNMLHLNKNGKFFSEVGLLGNVAATDWSWSALFADFNNDGEQDLFISNGIPKRPNDLDYMNFMSNDFIKQKMKDTRLIDNEALSKMPSGAVPNKIFRGTESFKFINKSEWISDDSIISNGTALGDLDNDGDIDIVTNNLNAPATIYKNNANNNTYFKIELRYNTSNTYGIGTKVFSYHNGKTQYKELFTSRGFQSSSEPILHFGYDDTISTIDSLVVIWPNNEEERFYNVNLRQTFKPKYKATPKKRYFAYSSLNLLKKPLFKKSSLFGIDYKHTENTYIDFNRQKLIPYSISQKGPATTVGDIDGDGENDIFFGSSKHFKSRTYILKDTTFIESSLKAVVNDSICEDEAACIFDINNDGKNDIYVASGGGEFYGTSKALKDRLYINNDTTFIKTTLPEFYINTSVIKPYDYDKDGDLDLFIGVSAISNDFGNQPSSYLLKNNQGKLQEEPVQSLNKIGMVTDAIWTDFNNDGWEDLIVVGEWMAPVFLKNDKSKLVDVSHSYLDKKLNGLWRTIVSFDIDHDGDKDYLLGNWGLNSKFKASETFPMKMYYGDFDGNSASETIVAIEKNKKYYPTMGLDKLSSQLESLTRKKTKDYTSFAGKSLYELFNKKLLESGSLLEVHTLASGYLKNNSGNYTFVPFSNELQTSTINCFLNFDFDNNGQEDVLCAGNFFGVDSYHGKLDAFPSALIKGVNNILLGHEIDLDLSKKQVKALNIVYIKEAPYLLVTINNEAPEFYKIKSYQNKEK